MAIPQLPKTVWSRSHFVYSWEVFLRNSYFSLSTFFHSLAEKGRTVLSLPGNLSYMRKLLLCSLSGFLFSQLDMPVVIVFLRSCFRDLLSCLLLTSVLSQIVLPFHQALCLKLDIVLMLGFSRGLNYQNILYAHIYFYFHWTCKGRRIFHVSHFLEH